MHLYDDLLLETLYDGITSTAGRIDTMQYASDGMCLSDWSPYKVYCVITNIASKLTYSVNDKITHRSAARNNSRAVV